jgi:hypothetical protein
MLNNNFFSKLHAITLLSVIILFSSASFPQQKVVFVSSPEYIVNVCFQSTGDCNPYTGATFRSLTFTAQFSDFKFVGSYAKGYAAMFGKKDSNYKIGGRQVHGVGKLMEFNICPDWETEKDKWDNKVTAGPNEFSPYLEMQLESTAMDTSGIVPLVETAYIRFNTNFGFHTLEFESHIAKGYIENYSFIFNVSLFKVGKGEDFEIEVPFNGESESGKWIVDFTAVK